MEIRIGGIHAPARIARDSESDYATIMQVLTAYVRQNAPWPPNRQESLSQRRMEAPPNKDVSSKAEQLRKTRKRRTWENHPPISRR